MSFQIMLQRNNSSPNYLNKDIVDVALATGVLKSPTSITDPVFLIDSSLSSDIIKNANYLYCETFGRYYYITNIISTTDVLWEIHCHVDVLMSFKNQILTQNAIVSRQENKFNMMLDDGWFMAYQDPLIQTKYLSAASPFENQEFVLVVAGS